MRLPASIIALIGFLFAAIPVAAAPAYVPASLEPWRAWVLDAHPEHVCPLSAASGSRVCLWPGRLNIDINGNRARFSQSVDSRIERLYGLPVAGTHWPLEVQIDGRNATVLRRNGRPHIQLPAGTVEITGVFEWRARPASVTLPPTTGQVRLVLDGATVDRPRWNANELYLGQPPAAPTPSDENRIGLAVYRVFADGAPPTMRLTVNLDVAGTRRDVSLGKVLPEGFKPVSLSSPLPARLDVDGGLELQVSPGTWSLTLEARTSPPLTQIAFERSGELWPTEEIWSYTDAPWLRVTEPANDRPVDPGQVGVPTPDRSLPAFLIKAGEMLKVVERQRGYSPDVRNELRLYRKAWMNYDGAGYIVSDDIEGLMRRDWRLDLAEPLELRSARVGDDSLLITQAEKSGLRGVEIRIPGVQVTAVSQLPGTPSSLPVSGWQTDIQSVSTTVNLPPGYRLLGATGVDRSTGDWASNWRLLDFFLVLIVAVIVWRTHSRWLGVMALFALVLTVHEHDAPNWSWLFLTAAIAALNVLPRGRLRGSVTVFAAFSLAAFAVIAVPFAGDQLTAALYPQLDSGPISAPRDRGEFANADQSPAADAAPAFAESLPTAYDRQIVKRGRYDNLIPTASRKQPDQSRYASGVQLQAGPGLPDWGGARYRLNWSGPIASDQTFRLVVLPPMLARFWRVAGIGLSVVVLAGLLSQWARRHKRDHVREQDDSGSATSASGMWLAAILGALLIGDAPSANAQFPDAALLEQLESRLLAPAPCTPGCSTIERARVRTSPSALDIRLIVHVAEESSVALPGDPAGWHANRVTVNGKTTDKVALIDGRFHIALPPGVHRVNLTGPMPGAATVTVAFGDTQADIDVSGVGWEVSGVTDRQLAGGALTLSRVSQTRDNEAGFDAMDAERFPAFVMITRVVSFDLDWSVRTILQRVTPPTAAINLSVPLLPGEAINEAALTVTDGQVAVSLAPGQEVVQWSSTLPRSSPVTLQASHDAPWQEIWIAQASPNWRLTYRGVPEDNRDPADSPTWQPTFTPWPGETLTLEVTRPLPVDGPTMAIDNVDLTTRIGRRETVSYLMLNYRATQGGQHALTLPEASTLTSIKQDGTVLARSLNNRSLTVPVLPGSHRLNVEWRENLLSALRVTGPDVDLGMPAANVTTQLALASDRWVLWTSGPTQGPAVLYWSELLVLVLVAAALGRLVSTPLNAASWLLLGLGFSTFFWPSFTIIVLTVLAFRWRETNTLTPRWRFNGLQIALGLLFILSTIALLTTIPFGLLGHPDMQVVGNRSSAFQLVWFIDRVNGPMPGVAAFTVPLWVYKALMLIWSLWLALSVLKWLPWMWRSWSNGGYWRSRARRSTEPSPESPT
ncbi:MAG: hypothetical protein AAF610_10675 [Pseudomonadota bacterium]